MESVVSRYILPVILSVLLHLSLMIFPPMYSFRVDLQAPLMGPRVGKALSNQRHGSIIPFPTYTRPLSSNKNGQRTKNRYTLYLKAVPCQPPVNACTFPLHMPYYTRCVKKAIQRQRKACALWKHSEFNVGNASDLYTQQKQYKPRRIQRIEGHSYE